MATSTKMIPIAVFDISSSSIAGAHVLIPKHQEKDSKVSILASTRIISEPKEELDEDASPNRLYIYGVVARLSMLAAAREMRDQIKG